MEYRHYWSLIADSANEKVCYFKRHFERYKRSESFYSPDEVLMEIARYQKIALYAVRRMINTL